MLNPSSSTNLVLGIIAENENQILMGGSNAVGNELKARGYRHHIIDMMQPTGNDELKSFLKSNDVAFAYGFAGVGSQFTTADGVNLWTAARIPFVALWFDHPCYNYNQHMVDSPYILHGYHVRDHIDVRQKYLPASSSSVKLLPMRYSVMPREHCNPFRNRERQIFYVKTGINPDVFAAEWKDYKPQLQDVMWALVEEAKENRNVDLAAATARLFAAHNQTCDNLGLFMGVIAAVDGYIRAWRSDKLARAMLHHPAVIIGRGWDYLDDKSSHAQFHPAIHVYEYIGRLQHYRVIANTNPLWRDGIHERVQMGMCCGGIALTDRTEKSDEVFGGLPNYIAFEWTDNLEDVISMALNRAGDDEADFFPATTQAVHEKVWLKTPDYITEIEQAINALPIP